MRGSPLDILTENKPAILVEEKEDDWNDVEEKENADDKDVDDDAPLDDENDEDMAAQEQQEDDEKEDDGAGKLDDDEERDNPVTDDFPQDEESKPQEQHLSHMKNNNKDAMGALPNDDKQPYPYNLDELVPPDYDFTTWTALGGKSICRIYKWKRSISHYTRNYYQIRQSRSFSSHPCQKCHEVCLQGL